MSNFPEIVIFSVVDANDEARYLSFTGPQKQLRFGTEDGVFSPNSKFTVEQASNGLVHIRSCSQNTYWVRAAAGDEPWLLASSPEVVEDMRDEGCTLFRPQISAGGTFVRFVHAASNHNVVMRPATHAYGYNLCVLQDAATEFTCINYSSLLKLPKYIMFKSDTLGKYIAPLVFEGELVRLMFSSDDPTTPGIGVETFGTRHGDFSFKSLTYPDLWLMDTESSRSRGNLISAAIFFDFHPDPRYTMFQLFARTTSQGNQGFALRNRVNNLFWCPILWNNESHWLAVGADSENDPSACFQVIDLGIPDKRQVTLQRESFSRARVYNITTRELVSSRVFENTSAEDRQDELKFEPQINSTVKYSFSNSVTTQQSMANFSGPLPFLSKQGLVVIPDEVVSLGLKAWGQTYDYAIGVLQAAVTVNVPAGSKVTATLLAKTATYEIPFSYQMYDEFYGGGTATQDLHDGVFKAEYTYSTEVRVDDTELIAITPST